MSPPTLLVLAAGMGSRYGGLKQIDPVGPHGETLIDYSVHDALRAGFGRLLFVIRKAIEQPFRRAIGRRFEDRLAVDYVFQELDQLPPGFTLPPGRAKPWGTAHAVLAASPVIHEPFAVINADDFYGAASYRILAQHLQAATPDFAMVGFVLRQTLSPSGPVARGLCRLDPAGFLEDVVELTRIEPDGDHARTTDASGQITPLTGDETVSMNMWGFTPALFPDLETQFQHFLEQNAANLTAECYLPTVVNELIHARRARVKVLHTPDAWTGVTYREDHPHVVATIARLIQSGTYPGSLWP